MRTLSCVAVGVLGILTSALGAQQRPAITGVAFARFYTSDAPAAKHFYADTLGYAGQEANGITRYPVNALQWVEVQPLPQPAPPSRMAAVAFTTRDAAALQRYLAAKGVIAEQPLRDGMFGVRDPEGNLVYFMQSGSAKAPTSDAASSRATAHRIIHVGFAVRSASAEDRFYRDVLGFHPYWHGGMQPDRTDWSSLQVPEGTDWLEYMLETPKPGDLHMLGVLDHVSLGVAKMDTVVAGLQRNGCVGVACGKAQLGKDGKVQLNLYDPDQSRVEFMEFAPKQQPCCSPILGKTPTEIEDR